MDKELIKLAFQLGYQSASEDLAKFAAKDATPTELNPPKPVPATTTAEDPKGVGGETMDLLNAIWGKMKDGGTWVKDKAVAGGNWVKDQADKHKGALAITGGVTTAAGLGAYLYQRAKAKKYQKLLEALLAEQEAAQRPMRRAR